MGDSVEVRKGGRLRPPNQTRSPCENGSLCELLFSIRRQPDHFQCDSPEVSCENTTTTILIDMPVVAQSSCNGFFHARIYFTVVDEATSPALPDTEPLRGNLTRSKS